MCVHPLGVCVRRYLSYAHIREDISCDVGPVGRWDDPGGAWQHGVQWTHHWNHGYVRWWAHYEVCLYLSVFVFFRDLVPSLKQLALENLQQLDALSLVLSTTASFCTMHSHESICAVLYELVFSHQSRSVHASPLPLHSSAF